MCSIQLYTFTTIVLVLQTIYYDHVAHLWARAPVEVEDLFPEVSALGVIITGCMLCLELVSSMFLFVVVVVLTILQVAVFSFLLKLKTFWLYFLQVRKQDVEAQKPILIPESIAEHSDSSPATSQPTNIRVPHHGTPLGSSPGNRDQLYYTYFLASTSSSSFLKKILRLKR